MRSLHRAQEELRSVGVRACVGHGEDAGASVLQGEILVSELVSIEVQGFARLAHTLLTGAQATEIFSRLRSDIRAQFHGDSSRSLPAEPM